MRSVGLWCARAGVVAWCMCVGLAGAAWVQTAGPEGGMVTAMAHVDDSLWAATYKGIHVSGDSGRTWSFSALPRAYVKTLHVHGGLLFAGTNSSGAFVRGADGQWDSLSGDWNSTVPALASWRDRLFILTSSRIHWSDDSGATWIANDSANPANFGTIAAHPDYLFAGAFGAGVFRSDDSGNTWITVNNGLPGTLRILKLFAVDSIVFASEQSSGLYRSVDNGDTWVGCPGPSGAVRSLAMTHSGDTVYMVTSEQSTYRSLDQGASWVKCLDAYPISEAGAICFGGRLVVSCANGIRMSDDGGVQWQASERSVITSLVGGLAQLGGTVVASAHDLGTRRTTDRGATWTGNLSPRVPLDIIALGGTLIGRDGSAILASQDTGASWSTIGSLGASASALVALEGAIYAGTYTKGVWCSEDSGTTWDSINTGLPNRDIRALCVVGGRLLSAAYQKGIYRLVGDTWVDSDSGVTVPEANRCFHRFAARDSSVLAAMDHTSGDYIFASHDAGETWSPAVGNAPRNECWNLSVVDSLILGAFGFEGLYATRDFGTTWHEVSEPDIWFGNAVLTGDTVLIGTEYRGVWKRPYSELLQATQAIGVGRDHVRAAPTTPTATHGHVLVLDVAGRLVKRVRADGRVRDVHGILSGLRPGTYVIRTASGTAKATAVTRY